MNVVSNKPRLSLLSSLVRGVWQFYSISNLSFTKLTPRVRYTVLPLVVGLVPITEANPAKITKQGAIGDYLFLDDNANLTLLDAESGKRYVDAN